MEKLVRDELERWDSESSIGQASGRGASPGSGGVRARSRPNSGQNVSLQLDVTGLSISYTSKIIFRNNYFCENLDIL